MSAPKTLSERLQWMADNLPGFKEELEAATEAKRRANQLDFWPDQRNAGMVDLARLSHVSAHVVGGTLSASEGAPDHMSVRRAAAKAPLGKYGESSFPGLKK